MTPDEITYRYSISYERARPAGLGQGVAQYAEPFTFQDVHAAMDAHHVARRGGWVGPGMQHPHVSALLVCSGGRIVGERLPAADLDEVPHDTSLAAHR